MIRYGPRETILLQFRGSGAILKFPILILHTAQMPRNKPKPSINNKISGVARTGPVRPIIARHKN